jgi:hypothetical protein
MNCHCGQPGTIPLGIDDYCPHHYDELLDSFDPSVFGPIGRGRGIANLGSEWIVQCRHCTATWHGHPGDICAYCERTLAMQIDQQADLALRPPDVQRDDPNWGPRMTAWAERLARAVKAGVVGAHRARAALEREVTRAA